MKIRDWIDHIHTLGDDDKVIGITFQHNGGTVAELTLAIDGPDEVYDATSTSGN